MELAMAERVGAIYAPLLVCLLFGFLRRRMPFRFTATLLGVLWVLPALVLLQVLNLHFGWWSFQPGSPVLVRGMPLELLLGWTLLWGVLPVVALPGGVVRKAVLLLALDVVGMPLCSAVVTLQRGWLVGEAVAAVLVLLPALLLAEWTERRVHVRGRAALQVLTAAFVFLFGLPELLFALRPGEGWGPLLRMHGGPALQLALEAVFVLALPGISAAQEFAERGGGTPLPFDPPQRLVTSGIYRYCANPMQVFCALTLLAWAVLLRSRLFALASLLTVAYSAGLALWDEQADLRKRFGEPWLRYRAEVKAWRMRWRPYHAGKPATLYLATSCGPCSRVRSFLEDRSPVELHLLDAEALPAGSIRRLTYLPGDGSPSVDGVRAMARAMEHLHLGWAWCGFLLRLPGVWQGVQLALDAGGLGPRTLRCEREPSRVIG